MDNIFPLPFPPPRREGSGPGLRRDRHNTNCEEQLQTAAAIYTC